MKTFLHALAVSGCVMFGTALLVGTLTESLAAQSRAVSFTVTLTADQVDALQAKFGTNVDVEAKAKAWFNDWMIQYTRELDEQLRVDMAEVLKTVKPTATLDDVRAAARARRVERQKALDDRIKNGQPQ